MDDYLQSTHKGKTPIAVKAKLEKVTIGSIIYVHLLVRPFSLVICQRVITAPLVDAFHPQLPGDMGQIGWRELGRRGVHAVYFRGRL